MTVEWVKLKLFLADFDEQAIADRAAQTDLSGISLVSLDKMAWGTAERRKLYELNRECSRDIPERGEFYSFPEYVEQRIEAASFDPRCVVVAIRGREWIGMTAASNHLDQGFMFDEMTGVLSAYRGRGLSLCLKLANIRRMRDLGATVIHTMHNVHNTAAIEMNRKLGYVPR
jgi:GNAT superfamily N-acetyltransferase